MCPIKSRLSQLGDIKEAGLAFYGCDLADVVWISNGICPKPTNMVR